MITLKSIFDNKKYIIDTARALGMTNVRISDYSDQEVSDLILVVDRIDKSSTERLSNLLQAMLIKKLDCQVQVLMTDELSKIKKNPEVILQYVAHINNEQELSTLFETENFSEITFNNVDYDLNPNEILTRLIALAEKKIFQNQQNEHKIEEEVKQRSETSMPMFTSQKKTISSDVQQSKQWIFEIYNIVEQRPLKEQEEIKEQFFKILKHLPNAPTMEV